MKQNFIVAHVNFFDNNLTQEVIEANTHAEACLIVLQNQGFDTTGWVELSYEELKQEAFNGDTLVSAFGV